MHCLSKLALLGMTLLSTNVSAWGQSAPALRAVVSATAAPEAMSQIFAELGDGEKIISVPGAAWLQLQFADVRIGSNGVLTITDSSGESQRFTQSQINAWGGLTAVFNGSQIRVDLKRGLQATEHVSAAIKDIIIGLPGSAVRGAEIVIPQSLLKLFGPDSRRFIPDELSRMQKEVVTPSQGVRSEAICGQADDRLTSANPRVGRVMPVGCTGWLIDDGNLLSAGHCIGPDFQTIEFNVPSSLADGTTQAPAVRDQYRVIARSIVSENGGTGNDWAVFQVLPNTETDLLPTDAQGATFELSNTDNPTQVRITGYGLDGPAPLFGNGPQNVQSQTQQTHSGTLSQNTPDGALSYHPDTQRGNSGSPVIVDGNNIAIGIHTDGGCGANGGTNAGTSFRNAALWRAIDEMPDIPVASNWQVALSNGTKFTGTGGEWIKGWATGDYWRPFVADVNGDKKADLVVWSPGDATHPSSWQVALSDGAKFTHAGVWSTGWATGDYWHPFVANVNGDMKADLVAWFSGRP